MAGDRKPRCKSCGQDLIAGFHYATLRLPASPPPAAPGPGTGEAGCYDCHDNLAIKNTAIRARDAALARAEKAEAERDEARRLALEGAARAVEETEIVEAGSGYLRADDGRATLAAAADAIRALVPAPVCHCPRGPSSVVPSQSCPVHGWRAEPRHA